MFVTGVKWRASNGCCELTEWQERCDGICGVCGAQVSEPRNLQKERRWCEDAGMVCRGSIGESRGERRKTVCVHHRRIRKSETHSQQPTRENRSVRHAWQSARRMGGSACGNRNGRRGCPRNAVGQQEVFSVETVAGIFRVLQPARTDRLRNPSGVKNEATSDVAEVSRSARRGPVQRTSPARGSKSWDVITGAKATQMCRRAASCR